jgi:two-component system NtrC family response regulator
VLGRMITGAPEMIRVARTIERVANTNVSVMLLGASGTGKELLARGLHDASDRAGAPSSRSTARRSPKTCSKASCSATKRAPSPARSRPPKARSSRPMAAPCSSTRWATFRCSLQVKLLRFLQERVIERIGSRKSIAVDTRVVCATHQNLEAMIADGRFREDLFTGSPKSW